jgi:hypothetical protein
MERACKACGAKGFKNWDMWHRHLHRCVPGMRALKRELQELGQVLSRLTWNEWNHPSSW